MVCAAPILVPLFSASFLPSSGLAAARFGPPREVVITDLESHLEICRENVAQNKNSINVTGGAPESCPIRVEKYDWSGEVPPELGAVPFDVIIGTDVVYHEDLYAPFIQALDRTVGPESLVLLGVTRTDTGPAFFEALDKVEALTDFEEGVPPPALQMP